MLSDKIQNALAKRNHLLSKQTDALRLVDGSGDELPGVFLDTFADHWLISTHTDKLDSEILNWLKTQKRTVYWKRLDQHEKDSPSHIAGPPVNHTFIARESSVKYQINFQAGYSQGIFLDQRLNRQRVRQHSDEGTAILNTFAYTGAFSTCAALGKATTTTLDLSQVYLDWARDNFLANDLDPTQHHFCKGDTFHWLKRFAKQGRQFDGIILDPPTFSRDDKGKVFRVEKDYHRLVALAHDCLAPGGWMLCCTNCRKLDHHNFLKMVKTGAPGTQISPLLMPEEYPGENYLKSLWLTNK